MHRPCMALRSLRREGPSPDSAAEHAGVTGPTGAAGRTGVGVRNHRRRTPLFRGRPVLIRPSYHGMSLPDFRSRGY